MALHGFAIEQAIENMSEKTNKNFEIIVRRMKHCLEKEPVNVRKYQNLNERFHLMIIDISEHERLKGILQSLEKQAKRISYKHMERKETLLNSYQSHIGINF